MILLMSAVAIWQAAGAHHHGNPFVRFVFHFGLVGLPVISAIDSSFVPLPIPGVTDILIIIYAANKSNLILLVGLATIGSALISSETFVANAFSSRFSKPFIEPMKTIPPMMLR